MSKISEQVLALSEGMLATVTNAVLFSIFWVGSSVGKSGSYGAARAFEETFEQIGEINYSTIKRAFYQLRERKFVKMNRQEGETNIQLTRKGMQAIESLIPAQESSGKWKGLIFIISYDIAEVSRDIRGRLRRLLRSLGCAMLHQSMWVTPFDPTTAIKEFNRENQVEGSIVISTMSKEAMIAGKRVKKLFERLYELDKMNERYQQFINRVAKKRKINAADYLAYVAICKIDPKLPEELLPDNWKGKKAYSLAHSKAKILRSATDSIDGRQRYL